MKARAGVVEHTCDTNLEEVETGWAHAQGYPGLHSELETNLGYMQVCLKSR